MRLVSAVFGREMVTLARRKRHYFARALVLGGLLAIIGVHWTAAAHFSRYDDYGFVDLPAVGRALYEAFQGVQIAAVLLLMPALASPVVAAEKERNTLGLLLLSNLSPRNILLDKLLSRVALLALLLVAGAPMLIACLAFGGTDPSEIVMNYIVVLGAMLFCGGVGVFFSTVTANTYAAFFLTYTAVAAAVWLAKFYVATITWLEAVTVVLAPGAIVFVLSVAFCSWLLPINARRPKRSALRRLFQRMNAFFHRINFTGVVLLDETRALKGNAMFWKEAHNHFFGSTTFLLRSFYALVALSLLFAILLPVLDWGFGMTFCSINAGAGIVLLAVILLVASPTVFARERDVHSLEVLMSTPLTARSIVAAKFVGVMKLTIPTMVFIALWLWLEGQITCWGFRRESGFLVMARLLLVFGGYAPLVTVIGLWSGAVRRSGGAALVQTVLICIAWCIVPFFVCMFFEVPGLGYSSREWILSFSPVWTVAGIFSSFRLFRDHVSLTWASFVVVPVWIAAMNAFVRRFDRIMGRAEQREDAPAWVVPILGALVAGIAFLAAGCGKPKAAPAGRFAFVIGSAGHTAGKFNRPRGITYDAESGVIFVVDWDGRIQKFSTNGQFKASWIMPDIQKGKPEDICRTARGTILVADTHYSRVVEFTADGDRLGSFGSYGRGPGEFIYPVGIVTDSRGDIYVSEYGENDRIQKFTPSGEFIAAWGGPGATPGRFQRPSGMAITTNDIIFVADAVNHRVQVFDTRGTLVRVIGKEGTGPGEFRYPYDVAVVGDLLYVLEYGNQRVQKLTLEGKPLGMTGKPGRGDGCFACPWRFEAVGDALYVSDTDNSRVVALHGGW